MNTRKGFMFRKNKRGFTLIEILVVIALISTLGTVIIVIINPVQQLKKARDAQRKSDLRQIQAALELYRADNAAYPAALPACGGIWKVGTSTYIQKVPCDPKNTGQYTYRYVVTVGTTYTLTSCLENVSDIQKDTSNNATYCSGGTTNWSYTLNNP